MFKKLPFVIVAMLLGVAANAQNWVSFGKSEPAAPEFSVISSDNHSVVFDLNVYGMFVESKTGGSQTYQRLSLLDEFFSRHYYIFFVPLHQLIIKKISLIMK